MLGLPWRASSLPPRVPPVGGVSWSRAQGPGNSCPHQSWWVHGGLGGGQRADTKGRGCRERGPKATEDHFLSEIFLRRGSLCFFTPTPLTKQPVFSESPYCTKLFRHRLFKVCHRVLEIRQGSWLRELQLCLRFIVSYVTPSVRKRGRGTESGGEKLVAC